jgi:NAD(P)-dependent dehydrogenase (short-subunit alcohol dehydrogenase family)
VDRGAAQDQAAAMCAEVRLSRSVLMLREPLMCGIVEARRAAFGGPDILVSNAGFTRAMRITKTSETDWDLVVDVIPERRIPVRPRCRSLHDRKLTEVVSLARPRVPTPGTRERSIIHPAKWAHWLCARYGSGTRQVAYHGQRRRTRHHRHCSCSQPAPLRVSM